MQEASRETGGQPTCGQGRVMKEGRRRGGSQAPPKRERTRSGSAREGWRSSPAALGPPRGPRFPGDPAAGASPHRGPPGPSAPRLPRPGCLRLGPALVTGSCLGARATAARRWDGAELPAATAGPGVRETSGGAPGRPLGSAVRHPAHRACGSGRAASCWTGGVRAPLRASPWQVVQALKAPREIQRTGSLLHNKRNCKLNNGSLVKM